MKTGKIQRRTPRQLQNGIKHKESEKNGLMCFKMEACVVKYKITNVE